MPTPANNQYSLHEIAFPEWLPFAGTAEESGDHYVLRATSGGAIIMSKEDVYVAESAISVRDKAPAKIHEKPTNRTLLGVGLEFLTPNHPCVKQDDCPSKCCACIGLVRVCCGSGGTRGVCLGVWSCPG